MWWLLDGGDNVKIEENIMLSVKAGFVVYIHKNRLNFKVKRSKRK